MCGVLVFVFDMVTYCVVNCLCLSGAAMLLAGYLKYGTLHIWQYHDQLIAFAKVPIALVTGFSVLLAYFLWVFGAGAQRMAIALDSDPSRSLRRRDSIDVQ